MLTRTRASMPMCINNCIELLKPAAHPACSRVPEHGTQFHSCCEPKTGISDNPPLTIRSIIHLFNQSMYGRLTTHPPATSQSLHALPARPLWPSPHRPLLPALRP